MLESAIKEHPFFTRITAFLNTVAILGWCVGVHHSMDKNCMLYCTLSIPISIMKLTLWMCLCVLERGREVS